MDTHQGEQFPQNAFRFDWQAKTAICPHGKASASWSAQRKSNGTPVTRVHFAPRDCASCPARSKCTTAVNGKWGRSLTLLPADQQQVLETRRREQATEPWQQRYRDRGHDLPDGAAHRHPAHPLHRHGQNLPRLPLRRCRRQHRPHRRLAHRNTTRPDQNQPPHPTRTRHLKRPYTPLHGFPKVLKDRDSALNHVDFKQGSACRLIVNRVDGAI
ncbi:hypothetical protein FXF52_39955 [Micromonospora sp. MP36]|nr:hypothetical protein FXF52_39955 [Micromonospora sp. MP36]